jgi:FkbM family methyltransferase
MELPVLRKFFATAKRPAITTLLVGTHSEQIHASIISLLKQHAYTVGFECARPLNQPDGIILGAIAQSQMIKYLTAAPPNVGGSMEDWLEGELARYAYWFHERPLLVDVGAYHGDFAGRFMTAPNTPFREALLFEPNPESFQLIQRKLKVDARYHLERKACSDGVGIAKLGCSGEYYTGSLLPYEGERPGAKNEFEVDVTTLDAVMLAGNSAARAGLIKIDAQGKDLQVLRGAIETLRLGRPWLIVEMLTTPRFVNQGTPLEIMRFLEEQNYFLAAQFNEFYTSTGWLAWYDACFVPKELFSLDPLANFPRR